MKKAIYTKIIVAISILILIFFSFLYLRNTDIEVYSKEPLPLTSTKEETILPVIPTIPEKKLLYIEITDACDSYTTGTCVNMRKGPGEDYGVIMRLRTGIVLEVEDIVITKERMWYKIKIDSDIKFPERVEDEWYVASSDYIKLFENIGTQEISPHTKASTTKHIIVDLSEQTLYAYDGKELFMKELISTGLIETPTPRGQFTVYKKTPSRYMQGPLEGISDQYYDLPGVPWNLYFTVDGAVIHGTYWHNHFGKVWSHGCVNLSPQIAKKLYDWTPLGAQVTVQN